MDEQAPYDAHDLLAWAEVVFRAHRIRTDAVRQLAESVLRQREAAGG